jgi:Ca-activated chloride channel family protein
MQNLVFDDINYLSLLLVLPVVLFLYFKYTSRRIPVLLLSQAPSERRWRVNHSPVLYQVLLQVLSVILIILALANLKIAKRTLSTSASGIDIVLALDISKSMLMEDIKPNRLEALKDVLNQFIASRRHDRVGIVLYAGESLFYSPLTQNYSFLLSKINNMEKQELIDGTAIGVGLTSAVNALKESKLKSKVIVLLTDGENNTGLIDPLTAAKIAHQYGIKVYTIGIGSNGFAPISLRDINGDIIKQQVSVSIDEATLKIIAAQTGGHYFHAGDAGSLKKVYDDINALEKGHVEQKTAVTYQPLYQIFAIAALCCLLIKVLLTLTLFKTWV